MEMNWNLGTGTIFKMKEIKDNDANITCCAIDVGSREEFACVKV